MIAQLLSGHWDLALSAIMPINTSILLDTKFYRTVLKQDWVVLLTRTEDLSRFVSSNHLRESLTFLLFLENGTLVNMNSGMINTHSRTRGINSDCSRHTWACGYLLYCIMKSENTKWDLPMCRSERNLRKADSQDCWGQKTELREYKRQERYSEYKRREAFCFKR